MTEAMKWSVMKWLREKKKVRKTADEANAALDRLNSEVKQRWPDNMKSAYEALVAQSAARAQGNRNHSNPPSPTGESEASPLAKKMKDANDEAYRARAAAEEAFDAAEKELSTRLAREGCLKAIHSWDMLEEAIRKAESIRL